MNRPECRPGSDGTARLDRVGEPQAILVPLNRSAIFLVVTVHEGGEDGVRDLLADVTGLTRSVGFRVPADRLTCVTSIGSAAWDRLFGGPRPAALHPFEELRGDRHCAPATPGDLLFHLTAATTAACFELAGKLVERLSGFAEIVDHTVGFGYFEQRDLLGFVDGTENPTGAAAYSAALVGAEDPDFAGGSYVIVQKYLHAMADWRALSVGEQERVIGRTKLDDFELADQAPDSHVAMNSLTDAAGVARQILRANMPFGDVATGEYGTYYIAYAADPDVTETMLRRMFLGTDGAAAGHDRILDFSTAVTGTLFFTPPVEFLDNPPPPADVVPAPSAPAREADGSLGIGSLR